MRWVAVPVGGGGSTWRACLLTSLLACSLASCSPQPPMVRMAAEVDPQPSRPQGRPGDVCSIYRSMFPSSAIRGLESMFDDPRISTVTEGGDATPADVRAIRAAILEGVDDAQYPWNRVPEDLLARALRYWRPGPLPDCDWRRFAREVAAPARNGQVGPILTTDETGSYTRLSRPFFIDRDAALVLVRDSIRNGDVVIRKLVFVHRDGDDWAVIPRTFEERFAPAR